MLPIAPTPCILGGNPAAIGVRSDAEAANLDDGLDGLGRPVPTPPTKELVVALIALTPVAVCEIERLRYGFTVDTKSVIDSVIAPTASVAVEGALEGGAGGDAMAVTGVPDRVDDELKNDKLVWRECVPCAPPAAVERSLLSMICCFIAEGVIGCSGLWAAGELIPEVRMASDRRLACATLLLNDWLTLGDVAVPEVGVVEFAEGGPAGCPPASSNSTSEVAPVVTASCSSFAVLRHLSSQ